MFHCPIHASPITQSASIPWVPKNRRLSVRRIRPQPFPWPVRPFRPTMTYSKLHVNVFVRVSLRHTTICVYVDTWNREEWAFDRRVDHQRTPHNWRMLAAMAEAAAPNAIWWTDGLSRGRPGLWWCKLKFQNSLISSWTEASASSVQCVFRLCRIVHI